MIEPYGGGELVDLYSFDEKLIEKASKLKKVEIARRFVSDCEMMANGGFSPLRGFMKREEVLSVLNDMRLPSGLIWSIPIVLPVSADVSSDDEVCLVDKEGKEVAIMKVNDVFELDLIDYCKKVYGTHDKEHPGVSMMFNYGNRFVGGDIKVLSKPERKEVSERYYLDPKETRKIFEERGWNSIVAFQTRNPIHRAHEYLIKCALESADGFLIHPLVGETKADDIPADVRMDCYEILVESYFNKEKTAISVLPAAMRYAGPKEAILHMIVRQNYGCTHMIIGRDHAGVGDYYGTYEAQELVDSIADELDIKAVKFEHAFYCRKCENLATSKTCPHTHDFHVHLSGTKVRGMLKDGIRPPKEFSRDEVADILIDWASRKE